MAEKQGVYISKGLLALLGLVLTIVTSISAVVAYSVGVSNTAESALDATAKLEQRVEVHEDAITTNTRDIAVVTSQYEDIIRRLDSIEKKIDRQ